MSLAANIDSLWLTNSSLRSHWVSTVVSYVQTHGLDGVNVDFEDVIYFNETDRRLGLTLLLQELSHSLKSVLPKSQVCSFLVNCIVPYKCLESSLWLQHMYYWCRSNHLIWLSNLRQ